MGIIKEIGTKIWKELTRPPKAKEAYNCKKCEKLTIYLSPAKHICPKCYKELTEEY